jgi:hypothetical protein
MSQPTTTPAPPAELVVEPVPGPLVAVVPPPVRAGRRRRVVLAVLAAAALLALTALGVQLAVGLQHDAAATAAADQLPPAEDPAPGPALSAEPSPGLPPSAVPPPTAVLPPATRQPTGLGTDPALDGEAAGCSTGDMTACVQLYLESYRDPALARYTAYGDTCAGRQPAGTLRLCTASFPR